jgi:hypothetical protein
VPTALKPAIRPQIICVASFNAAPRNLLYKIRIACTRIFALTCTAFRF